jgi:hypothetical protein
MACKALLRLIDSTTALRPRRLISQLDPETAYRMRFAHQPIGRVAVNGVDELQESWKRTNTKWYKDIADRANTSTSRLGGSGSMLAVSISTGAGTVFHYDEGDDGVSHGRLPLGNALTSPGHFYSAILILQTGGTLMLLELGYEIEARPGDMVFFLANQQLHKLNIDRSTPDPTQIVLTLWTSDGAMELANPAAHTHADFQPASSLSGEVDSRYYVVEPESEDEYVGA